MKEQLITFETAKAVKEKGFEQNPYIIKKSYAPIYTNGTDIRLVDSLKNSSYNIATAPTQSLLKEWFREVHSIDVNVERDYDGWIWKITEFSQGNKVLKYGSCERPNYKVELEKGLQEALKLIEI